MANFVHLRLQTEFSVTESMVRLDEVVKIKKEDGTSEKKHVCPPMALAKQYGMPALAIADTNNMFGLVKFYKAGKENGVQPIPGVILKMQREDSGIFHVLALCPSRDAYGDMCLMLSDGYRRLPDPEKLSFSMDDIRQYGSRMIFLSGGMEGDIGLAILEKRDQDAKQYLQEWKSICGDRFYVEVQRCSRPYEEDYIEKVVQMADQESIPLVATHPIKFMQKEEFDLHETRTCISGKEIRSNPRRIRNYTPEQYFKSPEEMESLFNDLPDAIENTLQIARRCGFDMMLGSPQLPNFPVPEGMTIDDYMAKLANDGLKIRMEKNFPDEEERNRKWPEYQARLDFEIKTISNMKFPGYFLIVADFINWAKKNDVPVGPGRGSGAGSLVAYSLGITDLDPLPYDLLFERFLNPERVSMPDFDVDFCEKTRQRVIEYVREHYGTEAVSQIATFGTMAAKATLKDVGRAHGYSYGFMEKLAKMVPPDPGMTLKTAQEINPDIGMERKNDPEVEFIYSVSEKLEGLTRSVGKHAGGVLIAPGKITDFCPLYAPEASSIVSQFDKDDVESAGLVKFDFLGLRTLTIIREAVRLVSLRHGIDLDMNGVDLEDQPTWDLFKAHNTTSVFQVESKGMKGLLKKMQPDNFEDLVALVALFRPGPLQSGMVDDFINRKHGRADVDYMHPSLEPVLKPTYGVIVYQEQVMQIAQVIAGYTLGGADMLRRAMGKKKPEEMAKQRSIFQEGAQQNGIDPNFASGLFDLMEKFAEYGFNKSHSAAYALVTYQTAWLKVHYPIEFYSAVLTCEMAHTDKLPAILEDIKKNGCRVLPVDINKSDRIFIPENDRELRYGLEAIKQMGDKSLVAILEERQKNGPFSNFGDFLERLHPYHALNKRVIERLIQAGAFDSLHDNRAMLFDNYKEMMVILDENQAGVKPKREKRKSKKEEIASRVGDMFAETVEVEEVKPPVKSLKEYQYDTHYAYWTLAKKLDYEYAALGVYFSSHPFDIYKQSIDDFNYTRLQNLQPADVPVLVCGVVSSIFKKLDKENREMAFVQVDDGVEKEEILFFHDSYSSFKGVIKEGAFLSAEVMVSMNEKFDRQSLVAQRAYSFEQLEQHFSMAGKFGYAGPLPFGLEDGEDPLQMLSDEMTMDPDMPEVEMEM